MEEHMVPLVQRLAGDVGWASKVSACGLFPTVYPKVSPTLQGELRVLFGKLCEDDMPMVRRSAAANLGKLAAQGTAETIKAEYMKMFTLLAGDDQDNVRPLAIEAALHFAKLLSAEDSASLIIPALHEASKDRSWRVRHIVAEKYPALQEALGAEASRTELAPMLVRLLQDQEKEVRMIAAKQLPEVCKGMPDADRQTILTLSILPHFGTAASPGLASDVSQHVRIAVASVLVLVAPIIGKAKSIDLLVPLFIRMLKDEDSTVRLNIVSTLGTLQSVVGSETVSKLIIPEVIELAMDPQWRVRIGISEQIPALAKSMGEAEFDKMHKLAALRAGGAADGGVQESLTTIVVGHLDKDGLGWLGDNVFAIRQSATNTLSKLVGIFGEKWAQKRIYPKLSAMCEEKGGYLGRLTALFAFKALAPVIDKDSVSKLVAPLLVKLCKDEVPNVRFNVAQTLQELAPKMDKTVGSKEVKPQLETMVDDADSDVQYYSQLALACY